MSTPLFYIYSSLGLDFDYSVFYSDSETGFLDHLGCVVIVLEKTALLITMVGEKTLMGGIPGDVSITACRAFGEVKQKRSAFVS